MTAVDTPPHVWWSPFVGLLVTVQGGRARFLDLTEHAPVSLPEDAVQLVAVGVPHSAFPDGAAFVARQRALHTRTDDDPWCSCGIGHCGMRVVLDHLDHAEALSVPTAPQVYLEGDTVPAGRWVAYNTTQGLAASVGAADWRSDVGPVVELTVPTVEAWQAAVDRARAERTSREVPSA